MVKPISRASPPVRVAVAEVDYQDKWQRADRLGGGVVAAAQASEVLDEVERCVWSHPEVEVLALADRSWVEDRRCPERAPRMRPGEPGAPRSCGRRAGADRRRATDLGHGHRHRGRPRPRARATCGSLRCSARTGVEALDEQRVRLQAAIGRQVRLKRTPSFPSCPILRYPVGESGGHPTDLLTGRIRQ